ncbi:MAG: sulfatase-like hydrolase/transferase [Bacteroidetes bacterium]|nr:sulfatase-like hydrolase/transferase [Bacteroidota bacterium]MBT3751663.1 sulfatase-like hydrolase/transferase [Bacteroidota bacterium]MBT4400511.1 sulfatase-like hydrolase/transferase [Bacteroidota bacterium]MBT4411029.1 sulfatase-like hydrolase/transferase [Bacteroidota bacterium]MBT5425819.1 sulfatase-like hydrolase/transferase [Bacteroidota bacterium]
MKRLIPLLTLTLLYACASNTPPNIIVILADDAGYADFGFMGSMDLETPNLDSLASDGIVFSDAHVSATVCAPSRAGLITGRYQQSFGFECNIPPFGEGIDPDLPTIGNLLQSAGYKTIAIGKWHLGESDEYHPNNRGFDEFFGFLGGSRSYFLNEKEDRPNHPHAILKNHEQVNFESYLTDVFGDVAVNYIEQYKNQQFFIYLSFNAVHTPMQARKDHLDKYKDHFRQKLAAMTWSMDENVGKVIRKLKEEGLYENTLTFFLSDNGGATNNQSSVYPLKGWKGNKYEGGHRIPFTCTWPKGFKSAPKFNGLTSAFDIFATCLEVAKVENIEDFPTDGISLMPFLKGKKTTDPHESLFWRKDEMAGMRLEGYKLIRLDGYGYRLYDLRKDIGEMEDLSATEDSVLNLMTEQLEAWESGMQDPDWIESEGWRAVTYEIHQALMENRLPKYMSPGEMRKYFDNIQN